MNTVRHEKNESLVPIEDCMSNNTNTATPTPPGAITVTFLHPRGAGKRPISLNKAITGKMAIEGLIQKRFIEARPNSGYALVLQRTKEELPLERSLIEAGLEEGDVINVTDVSAGAGA